MANLELYKIFCEVAKEGKLTKASEKLNISQPAITKHIHNLENELNTTLFIRNKGMILTKKGQELFDKVYPAVKQIEEAEKSICESKSIVFGTYPTMLSKVLSKSIQKIYKDTNLKISIITEPYKELYDRFLSYDIDIVIIRKTFDNVPDDVKYIKLGDSEFVFFANAKSVLNKNKIDIKDLENRMIYVPRSTPDFIINKFEGITNKIKRIDSVTSSSILKNDFDSIGITDKNYIKEELKDNKLKILKTDIELIKEEYGIFVHKEDYKTLKPLIEIFKNYN